MKFIFIVLPIISLASFSYAQSSAPFPLTKVPLVESKLLKKDALVFIENKGQIHTPMGEPNPTVLYSVHDQNMNIFLKKSGLSYTFRKSGSSNANKFGLKERLSQKEDNKLSDNTQSENTIYRLDVELVNVNQYSSIKAEEEQQYHENFFISNSGINGITNAKSYRRIIYEDVYPHIDWVVYIAEKNVKYDFIVHPGGNPADIRLKYKGAETLTHGYDGGITAVTPLGNVSEKAPYSYEKESGNKVPSGFKIDNDVVSFTTGQYQGTLVIDPAIDWIAPFGGSEMDASYGIVSDKSGNVYMTGGTSSLNNMATMGSHQSIYGGGFKDAFIIKLDSAGNKIWGTYFGGDEWDESMSIAIDSLSNLYIAGYTRSTDNIATPGSHQDTYGGSMSAFLAKFDSSGLRIWSTYFGSSTEGYSVCIDKSENIILAGITSSPTGIATLNAHQVASGGYSDAFLAKFNPDGIRLWSTYYGGSNTDNGKGVYCDSFSNIYLVGDTRSTNNISSINGHQTTYAGGLYDGYLAKFSSEGTRIWATYYGGAESDYANAVICDRHNNIFITGETASSDGIATPGTHQDSFSNGYSNTFIVKFSNLGTRLWGTYYGGDGETVGTAITVDNSGNLYCGGRTSSNTNIATSDAFQTSYGGSWDMFISKFTNSGILEFGSYYGNGLNDLVRSVNYQNSGALYITGGDMFDNILTIKLGLENSLKIHEVSYSCQNENTIHTSFFSGGQANIDNQFTIELSNSAGDFSSPIILGTTNLTVPLVVTIPPNVSGSGYKIRVLSSNPVLISDTFNINIHELPDPEITSNGSLLYTGSFASYQWYLNGGDINGANDSFYTATATGDYSVMVSDTNGCSKLSDLFPFNISAIENVNLANEIKIYPNPTFDIVNIKSPEPITVEVFSIEGKKLLSLEKSSKVDMGVFPTGLYVLKIQDTTGRTIKIEKISKRK